MSERPGNKKRIKATQTAFEIIEIIAEGERLNTSELADQTGYSRSTIHYHLQTLQEGRYVIREKEGFRLGLRMSSLGELAREQHDLGGIVEKPIDDLAEESGGLAQITVIEGNRVMTLYAAGTVKSEEISFTAGMTVPAHATAYGQALLSSLPEEDASDMIGETLSAYTPKTITNHNELFDSLETTQELGFAYSIGEYLQGITSVAAPISVGSTGKIVGAVGITNDHEEIGDPQRHVKARRFSDELPGTVQRTAQIIGEKIADAD